MACHRRGFDSLCSHRKRFRKLSRFFCYAFWWGWLFDGVLVMGVEKATSAINWGFPWRHRQSAVLDNALVPDLLQLCLQTEGPRNYSFHGPKTFG